MSAAYLGTETVAVDTERKVYEGLRAALAFRGYSLARSNPADGPVTFWAARWGLCTELRTLADVAAFAKQVGA